MNVSSHPRCDAPGRSAKWRYRRVVQVTMLCGFLALAYARAASAADPAPGVLIAALPQRTIELLDDGNHPRVEVPFEYVPGVDPKRLSARLVEVAHVGRIDQQFLPAFTVSALSESGVFLDVDFNRISRPGEYRVLLELREKEGVGSSSAPKRQRVEIALNHPAARLRVPGSVLIVRTVGLGGSVEIAPPSVTMFEESRRSRATLRFETVNAASLDGLPVSATVGFQSVTIGPGGSAPVTPLLKGAFPIGSTKATLAARADQVEDPMTFDVEVRSRREGWLIFPIVLVSAMLGWFLRVYLRRLEELYVVMEQAENLVRQLEIEQTQALAAQRKPLTDAIAALRQGVARSCAEDLSIAIRDGSAALAFSQAQRRQWRTDVLQQLSITRTTLTADWRLPVDFEIEDLRNAVASATAAAMAGNIDATARHREAVDAKISGLLQPGRQWGVRAARAIAAAEETLKEPIADDTRPLVTKQIAAVNAAAALDTGATSSLESILRTIHSARSNAVDYARDAAWRLDRLATRLAAALEAPDRATKFKEAVHFAADPEVDSIAVIESIPDAVERLRKELTAAIAKLLPTPDGARDQQRQKLLQIGKLLAAARSAGEEAHKPTGRVPISSLGGSANARAELEEPPIPTATTGLGGTTSTQMLVLDTEMRPIVAGEVRSLSHLATTRLVRGAAAAILLAAVTTLLYYDTFIGRSTEILSLSAVAFMSDFTFESALDAVLKKRV